MILLKKSAATKRQKRTKRARSNVNANDTKGSTKRDVRKNHGSIAPDALALSKNDILEFCDRVLKKWQQDPLNNARNIAAMLAVRTSVLFSDEVSLRAIWSEIISWIYQLLYENAQALARKEGWEWAQVFSKIKNP